MLPNARTQEGVALLTPGVTVGVGGRVQIRGAQTSGNLYLLDGQNIADNAYNNRGVALIDDSIEETQVVTGAMSAEYGDVDGGVINSITRSGSNEFSGSLRWELSDAAWNALAPRQDRTAVLNVMNETKTLFVSGPILKDTLWFAATYFTTKNALAQGITADLSGGAGNYPKIGTPLANQDMNAPAGAGGLNAGYNQTSAEIRRQAKLTWSINQDHTLVAAYMRNANNQINRNYSAGETLSLVPQISTSDFFNLALRSAWSSNLTTEVRYGKKHQNLSAGGAANGQSPFYADEASIPGASSLGAYYNNGIFDSSDGGDERDNQTLNLKASLFWNAAGSHQTDFGIDYYQGTRKAKNSQTPTGYIIEVFGMTLNPATQFPVGTTIGGRMAFGESIWTYQNGEGSAKNDSYGLYVNDKWSLDQNWNFQFGVRFDKYEAKNESGSSTAGANGISPRLGVKYDLFGDSKHIFGASFARYNAKVLEGITNSVTSQGNPTEIDYAWKGAATPQTFAALQNLANYDLTPAGIQYYNDPKLNVKLSNNLKAPTTDEIQVSYAYSFNFASMGDGYVKVTAVDKKWKNLIDYSVGNNGVVATPTGNVYIRVWDNNPDAVRTYKGLELESQYNVNQWSILGNITWSQLKGNYEGEGTSSPARGEGLNNFNVQNGVTLYDRNWTTPQGYLAGHDPLRMRWTGSRTFNSEFGKTSVGLVYRFDSGAHYSEARSITRARLGGYIGGVPANGTNISPQWGASGTQYMNQERGAGVYMASSYLDLALTHDFPLFKVGSKAVTAFGKLNIGNVLNHQQQVTFNTSYGSATGTYGIANQGVDSPWLRGANYGQPTAYTNYGTPRTITASAGFRF
jgi:outer membrane receptor for ferrienterochelin and colicin